jgi:hypothetical protein
MHIPVIILTTSDRSRLIKCYARACSYITKPMDFDKFKDVVTVCTLLGWWLGSVAAG